jgi:hypothetical protein
VKSALPGRLDRLAGNGRSENVSRFLAGLFSFAAHFPNQGKDIAARIMLFYK